MPVTRGAVDSLLDHLAGRLERILALAGEVAGRLSGEAQAREAAQSVTESLGAMDAGIDSTMARLEERFTALEERLARVEVAAGKIEAGVRAITGVEGSAIEAQRAAFAAAEIAAPLTAVLETIATLVRKTHADLEASASVVSKADRFRMRSHDV